MSREKFWVAIERSSELATLIMVLIEVIHLF